MAFGNQTSKAGIDGAVTNIVLDLRNALNAGLNENTYLQNLGQTGLENIDGPGQGYSPADATNLLAFFALLAGFAEMANGGTWPATLPPLPQDLVGQSVQAWAGQ